MFDSFKNLSLSYYVRNHMNSSQNLITATHMRNQNHFLSSCFFCLFGFCFVFSGTGSSGQNLSLNAFILLPKCQISVRNLYKNLLNMARK